MTKLRTSFRVRQVFKMVAIGGAALFLGKYTANADSSMPMGDMPGMASPGTHGEAEAGKNFSFGEPGNRAEVDRTVTITMKDISFDPTSLKVKVGETIRFVVTNKGELNHDFTLGDVEAQTAHRKEMAAMLEKGGEMHHGDDPNAISVKAGETGELIWKFTRAGGLEFDCNVPGHYEAGMTGVIVVRG